MPSKSRIDSHLTCVIPKGLQKLQKRSSELYHRRQNASLCTAPDHECDDGQPKLLYGSSNMLSKRLGWGYCRGNRERRFAFGTKLATLPGHLRQELKLASKPK